MKWNLERDQPILVLRVIALSRIWSHARTAMFNSLIKVLPRTPKELNEELEAICL
jgi:hypothetical protein